MFDSYGAYQASSVATSAVRGTGYELEVVGRAVTKFQSLRMKALSKRLVARLAGRSRSLLDLDDVRREKTIEAIHEAGCVTVDVAKIKGSECRVSDFDSDFLPLNDAICQRWAGLYAAQVLGVSLPAVSLVQVGDVYYVRDGHHRVSVARLMGMQYLEANVQVWQVAGEVATAPAMSMQLLRAI